MPPPLERTVEVRWRRTISRWWWGPPPPLLLEEKEEEEDEEEERDELDGNLDIVGGLPKMVGAILNRGRLLEEEEEEDRDAPEERDRDGPPLILWLPAAIAERSERNLWRPQGFGGGSG